MSFQAYLDNIEVKTGKTPNQFIAMAKQKGFDSSTKAGEIVDWLKTDFGLGRGHAMAIVHIIKNGPKISEKHVGTAGVHRDDSDNLKLDGQNAPIIDGYLKKISPEMRVELERVRKIVIQVVPDADLGHARYGEHSGPGRTRRRLNRWHRGH